MPRFLVTTTRSLKNVVVIEAPDEDAARHGDGFVIDEVETDTWLESVDEVEQVDDYCDAIPDGVL